VQPCPRQPARPATFLDDNEFLAWVRKALFAGAVCRSVHDKSIIWMSEPPT
jgi:hypothetical protein